MSSSVVQNITNFCPLLIKTTFVSFCLSMLLCSVFLMMHDVFHKAVYHLLLFLFLVHIVNILTWCFLPCWMRIAAFNLTIAYLTFSQLLFCFEDVKFVPFTLFFLALLKCCFSCAKDFMCFMILVCFFFWLPLYSLFFAISVSFVLSYQSLIRCWTLSSFNGLF